MTPKGFLEQRTTNAEVDLDQYRQLLRWLTFVTSRVDHYETFGQSDLPNLTWGTRRNEDDVFFGTEAFPVLPDRGRTHIQLFAEGHPTYSALGISAIVGTSDEENRLQLYFLSSDGSRAWVNGLYTGEPLGNDGFNALIADFQEIVV